MDRMDFVEIKRTDKGTLDGQTARDVEKINEHKKRTFRTGATRDTDAGKYDYEGFLSPLVLERYGEYMHGHRSMEDGSIRDSDNWQKGMELSVYIKSAWRHFHTWWKIHRGYPSLEDLEDTLCAELFNVSGYLHETIKARLDKGV